MRLVDSRIARCALAIVAAIVTSQMPATRAHAQKGILTDILANGLITESEIAQRGKLKRAIQGETHSREEIIRELRDEKCRIIEARQLGVEVSDTEVDAHYARMATRMNQTAIQLTENFARAGIDTETVKHRIRAEIAWQQYQQRYQDWRRRRPAERC